MLFIIMFSFVSIFCVIFHPVDNVDCVCAMQDWLVDTGGTVLRSKKSRNVCGLYALKQVIYKAAAEANLPHEAAPVERHEANGRAELKVRHLQELLQVLIEDTRARGMVFTFDHTIARWAVRHTEWARLAWPSQTLKKGTAV